MLKSSIGILCLLCKDTNNIQKTYWEFNPKLVIRPKQTCIREFVFLFNPSPPLFRHPAAVRVSSC